jgi:MFS family permease
LIERASGPEPESRAALSAVLLSNVLFAAGLFSHAFLYNFYLEAIGLRPRVFGNAAAALTAGGLLALIPAGIVVDRMGPRIAYRIAAILLALGLGGGALVTRPLPIYGCALIAGLGTAVWRVAMSPLLMQQAPASLRNRVFSWNVAALVGFGALWTFFAGAAPAWIAARTGLSPLESTRTALLIGAFGSVLGALLLLVLRRASWSGPESPPPNRRTGFRVPPVYALLALVIGVWMTASGLVLPFFNLFFHQVHDLPLSRVGTVLALAQLVSAAGLLLNAELSVRLGAYRTLTLMSIIFAPLLWILAGSNALWLAIAVYLLQSVIPPATNALIDQLLMEYAPADRRGAVSSWRNAATEASGFAGASAGGLVLERGTFRVLIAAAGVIALVGAALLSAGFRHLRQSTRSAPLDPTTQQLV